MNWRVILIAAAAIFRAEMAAAGPIDRGTAVVEAYGELPADTLDQYGDTIGGIGSGIIYDAREDVYFCVSDRGPGDGTMPYRPRIVVLKIDQEKNVLIPSVKGSIILRDQEGREMTGLIPDDAESDTPRMKDGRTCIDPEGIVFAPDGTFYLSEEYMPAIYQFKRNGEMIRRLDFPEEFRPRTTDGRLVFSDKETLATGRNVNQGPEGMSLMPDGKTLAVAFQSGLVQDGAKNSPIARILLVDMESGAVKASYAYPFADTVPGADAKLELQNLSVNDVLAISETKFLVLERDNFGRDGAAKPAPPALKSVWLADIEGASNLAETKAGKARLVKKSLVFNLPQLVPDASSLAAKWEGIALLRSSEPGEVALMMTADNDFLSPVIHENGGKHTFRRAEDSVPAQFFKIRAVLPEIP